MNAPMHRPLSLLLLPVLLAAPAMLRAQEESPPPPADGLPPLERVLDQATVFARQATEAMRNNDWKTAADMWENLLKIQPDSAAALSNLGSVEIKLDKPTEARAHLEKAVALRPNLPAAWMTLGMLHLEQKNPMLAVSCLTRAVHEDPSDPRLHNALAIALKQIGWTNGAEQELQRTIDLSPDFAEAHFNLALIYLEQQPPAIESARRHYFFARDLGAPPDELVDKQFKEAGIEYVPPDPNEKKSDKPTAKDGTEQTDKPTPPPAKPTPKAPTPTKSKPAPKSKPKSK